MYFALVRPLFLYVVAQRCAAADGFACYCIHQVFTAYSLERMNRKLPLLSRRNCLCFSFKGLFFLPSDKRGGEGWRGHGSCARVCCAWICPLTHTPAQAVFFIYHCALPLHPRPIPEYAMKAEGSLVPAYFHNLVCRRRERQREKAREESFSLSPIFFQQKCCCLFPLSGRKKRKWLPFMVELGAVIIICFPLMVFIHLK